MASPFGLGSYETRLQKMKDTMDGNGKNECIIHEQKGGCIRVAVRHSEDIVAISHGFVMPSVTHNEEMAKKEYYGKYDSLDYVRLTEEQMNNLVLWWIRHKLQPDN